jgi:hypothetical protein
MGVEWVKIFGVGEMIFGGLGEIMALTLGKFDQCSI